MTHRRVRSGWGRVLGVALCYVIALQAFLAAFETTIASAAAPDAGVWVICHNAGGPPPADDGSGRHEKLPCVMCATAASGLAVSPDVMPAAVAPTVTVTAIAAVESVRLVSQRPSRAGQSRAPPQNV